MKRDVSHYSGRVHTVFFADEEKAFYILRMTLDAEYQSGGLTTVTVKGEVPGLKIGIGTWFGWEAVGVEDPVYGPQQKVVRAPVIQGEWTPEIAGRILLGQGVGASLVEKLRNHLGEDMVAALNDAERVRTVPGFTRNTAEHVSGRWAVARAHYRALEFLGDLGLPQGRIKQVWQLFGDKAQEVLSTNPWALVQMDGVTFADADAVAERLSLPCAPNNPLRVRGAVLQASNAGRGYGHLYSSTGDLLEAVRTCDPLMADGDIARALKGLADEGLLVLDRNTQPGTVAVYDPWSHKLEAESARLLVERRTTAALSEQARARYIKALGDDGSELSLGEAVTMALARVSAASGLTLATLQEQGVVNALTEPVSVLTGLPGTGKTTALRAVILLLQEAGVQALILAPTGIAAKRVSSVTGAPASTIHRAFQAKGIEGGKRAATYSGVTGASDKGSDADGSDEVWGYSEGRPHPAEIVIVDESSMVDQHVLYRILTCTRKDARLVFVGDAAQLPSVGPGNVLKSLVGSGLFPTVSLTEIYRQGGASPIVIAAHAVHRGEVPEAPVGTDFALYPMQDEVTIAQALVAMSLKLYGARIQFQVLSPRHSGTVGVTLLNQRLREALNPKQPGLQEVRFGGEVLREDDRVMVVKNNYKLGVFNGDLAKVASIDRKAKEIEIKVHGPPVQHVRIPFSEAVSLLRLAYAVTVHKVQGLEFDVILMPMVTSFGRQLRRNLFYTAITRARKKVALVGQYAALARAVNDSQEEARNTLFLQRLLGANAVTSA